MSTASVPYRPTILRDGEIRGPRLCSIDEVEPEQTEWLLPHRMHRGALSLIEGDPSSGKSCFLSELTAVLTTGREWLGRPKSAPAGVLWLTSEELPFSTIMPRLARAGADMKRVKVIDVKKTPPGERVTLPGSVRWMRDAARAYDLALIILDPLVSYVAPDVVLTDEVSTRAALDPAALMCMEEKVTIAMVRQLKKDRTGPRIGHGLGGMAIAASARSILQFDRPDGTGVRRVMRTIKCSPGPEAPALTYSLIVGDGTPIMVGTKELNAQEDDPAGDLVDIGERHVRDVARDLLTNLLKEKWVASKVIFRIAEDCGIGQRTLWKVKAELRCGYRRDGVGEGSFVEWGPPGSADPPPSPPCRVAPQRERLPKSRVNHAKSGVSSSPELLCRGGHPPPVQIMPAWCTGDT